jgi:putative flippase GtrA
MLLVRSTFDAMLNPRVLRFVALGLIGAACDITTFWLLYARLGAPVVVSSAAAWSGASTALFVVARLWVFPDAQNTLPASSARYVALIVANGLVTVSVTSILVGPVGLPYIEVRILMSAVIIPLNYLISQRWVFDTPRRFPHGRGSE